METIIDVLNFLNEMEMFNILSGVEYDTFKVIRKILIDEFTDVDVDNLVEMLGTVDDLYIEYLRKKVYFDKSLITALREKICDMYELKMVEKTDDA